MNRILIIRCLIIAVFAVAGQETVRGMEPAGRNRPTPAHILKNYQVVWEDKFDGITLNTSKWKYRGEGTSAGKYATVSRNNVELDGKGHMLIKITKDGEGKYYTARMWGYFATTYGYFECRAAMNKQLGPEVIFLLYSTSLTPVDPAKKGGAMRSTGYVSIFQYHRKAPDKIRHAVSWREGPGTDQQKINKEIQLNDIGEGFHTFGMEWTKEEYIFYVDGKETWRTSEAVSQQRVFPTISVDLSGRGGDPAQGNFPDAVTFDYVKVYKPK
jgi:beta-glucanase (GH16 family)